MKAWKNDSRAGLTLGVSSGNEHEADDRHGVGDDERQQRRAHAPQDEQDRGRLHGSLLSERLREVHGGGMSAPAVPAGKAASGAAA